MSETYSITLNGQPLQAPVGATIREVAESRGITIPTFCHDDRLQPFASCFLCVVEVENARGLIPACSTRVTNGMVITTDSERVIRTRQQALNLLLSDHAGDCIAPCEATCPAHIDIQGYIAHIANGQFAEAVRLIKQNNPLPVVCGRICPHPCESQCRRALVDEAVAINPLKRFAAEYELGHDPFVPQPGSDTGKRVAIVGGGPAGLSAAYYLRLQGHAVTIFEALPELGGMARYGIPRFRLPWELMDREIRVILDMGVEVRHGQRLGKDFSVNDLRSQGFDAVLVAIGAHKAKPMGVENEQVAGVIGGVDFLRRVVLGENFGMEGKRVAVIGGGDTAMDCARVSRRLGGSVTLLYRRTQAEMPALPMEQEETHEEGVTFRFLTAPVAVIAEQGQAKALRVITMVLGEPDASGRRRPMPEPGSEKDLPFDLIIAAIGQDPDLSWLTREPESLRPDATKWHTLVYDEKTQVTSVPGLFTAGDCAFGPDILIRAVGEGHKAAQAIGLYLNGAEVRLAKPYAISRGRLEELERADFEPRFVHKQRALETTLPSTQRLEQSWMPINIGLDQAQAMAEASRCIECGCAARFDCELRRHSSDYQANEKMLAGARRRQAEDRRHPLIRIEADKCITCGSCVRVCSEVRGIHALAFVNRGFGTRIMPNFGDALQNTGCDACGMCMDLCPTAAITPNTGKECGPWNWITHTTHCTSCTRGCALRVQINNGRVVKVQSVDHDPANGAMICAEGRFSHQLLDQNPVRPEEVESALHHAEERLDQAVRMAVVVSPWRTVEEIYAAWRLAQRHGGSLHYVTGETIREHCRPHGRIVGEANLALLDRLDATPWRSVAGLDTLVLLEAPVDSATLDDSTCVIALETHPVLRDVSVWVPVADPLQQDGAVLDREGSLVALRKVGLQDGRIPGLCALRRLARESDAGDLRLIRAMLADRIPELAVLPRLEAGETLPTNLPPRLAAASQDTRHQAFVAHMAALSLNWE